MTDSNFHYQLMLRVLEARARGAEPTVGTLLCAVAGLQGAFEGGRDIDAVQGAALAVACVALRLAVETIELPPPLLPRSPGLPSATPIREPLAPLVSPQETSLRSAARGETGRRGDADMGREEPSS